MKQTQGSRNATHLCPSESRHCGEGMGLTQNSFCSKTKVDWCLCVWQVSQRLPTSHLEVSPLFLNHHSCPTSTRPKLLHCPVLTFHPFVSESYPAPLPNLIHFCSFLFVCSFFCVSWFVFVFVFCFFLLLLLLLLLLRLNVRVCGGFVCVCVCSLQLPPLITVPLQTDAAPG